MNISKYYTVDRSEIQKGRRFSPFNSLFISCRSPDSYMKTETKSPCIHSAPKLTCFTGRIRHILSNQISVELPVQHAVRIDHPEEYPVAEERPDHDQPCPGTAVRRGEVG